MILFLGQRLSKSQNRSRHDVLRCVQRFRSRRFFSTEEEPPPPHATIVQGPSLLASTGVHRPSPSLFFLPGLRSLPFWAAPGPPSRQTTQPQRHRIAFNDGVVAAAVKV